MSTRVFAAFRRNQKQWMVVLTVLSMVSFLFLDDFGRGKGPMSAFGGGLMIGCLCAAGMCIIGYSRQKTAEFGVGGFLVGFLVGFLGFGAASQNKPVVRTAVGNFNRSDLEQLASQRQKANQFVFVAARKTQDGGQASGFGGIDDQTLITYRMLLADAKKMGIRVSDERVNDYLKQLTKSRLSKQDFKDCLRDARLGESELFELLKDELSAQLVVELMYPPAFVATAPPGFAQYVREPLRYMQQTPQQLWDSFQMLNLKQSLQGVAIPVQDFVGEVGQPSESQLAEFFEKYKKNQWIDEARPGFVQMPLVQLAYLTADFEKFESGIDPTDDDVREYYEKNKDRYRAPESKESTAPKLPDGEGEPSKTDLPEADALKPEESAKSPDAEKKIDSTPGSEEKKSAESDPKKGANQEKIDETKNNDGAANKARLEPNSESRCGEGEVAAEKTATDEPAKDASANDDKGESKSAAVSDPAKPESSTATPPGSRESSNVKSDEKAAGASVPSLNTSPEALPEPKFRDLNDDLKLEIQGEILRERAFAKIATALDRAYEAMKPLGLEYDTATDPDQKKQTAKLIAEKMKQYADDHNLEYKETPEWMYEELSVEPIGMGFEGLGRSSVVSEVFMRGDRDEPRMPLYSPRRADLRTKRGAFAYWKIGDSPARLADLKEDAVHEKVVRAWRFDQARLIAEKRATSLAEKAKSEGANLIAAVSGESATGEKNDPQLSVVETPEFTWLTTSQSVPSAQQEPVITDIPLIASAGNDFMKTVFENLGEGEVGVAVNDPRSVFYVVKVKGRETAKDDGGVTKQEQQKRFLAERFTGLFPIIKSPYESLAQFPQRQIDQAWRRDFEKRHNVEWEVAVPQPRRRR